MSGREEYHTVRLPKGWTPAKVMEFAKVVDLLGRLGRLGIENAALRRERRALRKAVHAFMRADVSRMTHPIACMNADLCVCGLKSLRLALAPKARRRRA